MKNGAKFGLWRVEQSLRQKMSRVVPRGRRTARCRRDDGLASYGQYVMVFRRPKIASLRTR